MRIFVSIFCGAIISVVYSVLFNFDLSTVSILAIGWANLIYQALDK